MVGGAGGTEDGRGQRRWRGLRRTALIGIAGVAVAATLGAAAAPLSAEAADQLSLVSRHGTKGIAGDGDSFRARPSATGRFIAFESDADNLSNVDEDDHTNVFVKNMQTGELTLVSRTSGVGPAANGDSSSSDPFSAFTGPGPSISEDGRFVVFQSEATNLDGPDTDGAVDIFIRDLEVGLTRRVSPGDDGAPGRWGSISPDGRYVAYTTFSGVELWDRLSGKTEHLHDEGGFASLSRNAEYVAFDDYPNTFVMRRSSGNITPLTSYDIGESISYFPVISADGSTVAYGEESAAGETSIITVPRSGSPRTVVTRTGEVGDGFLDSRMPHSISGDGRRVAFSWHRSSDGDNGAFVRDMATGALERLSKLDSSGEAIDGRMAAVSVDGLARTFTSFDERLDPAAEGDDQVYVRAAPQPPPPPPPPPVIFIPGFAASEIECYFPGDDDTTELYPAAITDNDLFPFMELAKDGVSPARGDRCSQTARPTGMPVDSVLGIKNIHGDSMEWLDEITEGRSFPFGWDWRKGPEASIERLDRTIDLIRERLGVEKVVILNHSYGGLLTRLYIDDPRRAAKVSRVANIGSPFWGAPKTWLVMTEGIDSPKYMEKLDWLVENDVLKSFVRNLTGAYYLFPNQAWHRNAPPVLRSWLRINGEPLSWEEVMNWLPAWNLNESIARRAAETQAKHIDGFIGKASGGPDWRTFVGSGLPTLGHYFDGAAYAGRLPEYSWVNGDGTVPVVSQRQFSGDRSAQKDQVPTYYVCGIEHTDEPEDSDLQEAIEGFILRGSEPSFANGTLRNAACPLEASEFTYSWTESREAVFISEQAEAQTPGTASRDRRATAKLSLDEAEQQGLVDIVERPQNGQRRIVFVTTTAKPLTITFKTTKDVVRVTPLTGDLKRGKPRDYGPLKGAVTITANGAKAKATRNGKKLKPSKPDRRAPRTAVKRAKKGKKLVLRAKARDRSGVIATLYRIGKAAPKPWRGKLELAPKKAKKLRYSSTDTFGNTERWRKLGRR